MFTSILSSIIIWSAVLIIALRVVTNSGIQFSNNKYISELTCYKGTSSNYKTTKKDILCVFLLAFSFRIIVFLFSVVIIYMFNDNINSFGDILEQYMKWDANNYVRIATGGYTYYTEGENFTTLAFFSVISLAYEDCQYYFQRFESKRTFDFIRTVFGCVLFPIQTVFNRLQ